MVVDGSTFRHVGLRRHSSIEEEHVDVVILSLDGHRGNFNVDELAILESLIIEAFDNCFDFGK